MTIEQRTLLLGTVVGAAAGAAVAYMFFTEEGRRFRVEAERNIDMLAQEAERLMTAFDQVRQGVGQLRGDVQSEWTRTA